MSKKLFIFAHKGEAQTFIQKLQMRLIKDSFQKAEVYQNEQDYLLVSGEGSYRVIFNLTHLISSFPQIEKIYNFGIAGILDSEQKEKINQIYPINICYSSRGNDFNFQSFSTQEQKKIKQKLSCISTDERIKNQETATKLSIIADLVDRESWSIGYVCHFLKKKFYCYKMISDIADEKVDCFELKQKAKFFSDELYKYAVVNSILGKKNSQQKIINQNEASKQNFYNDFSIEDFLKIIEKYFHCSHYQKKKIFNLLDLIVIDKKIKWSKGEVFNLINPFILKMVEMKEGQKKQNQKNLKKQNLKLDKKKLNLLITKIEEKINPFQKKINEKIKKITANLTSQKINFQIDNNFQNDKINFSFSCNGIKDYSKKIMELQQLKIDEVYKVLNGK